jgi:hypothetical protein
MPDNACEADQRADCPASQATLAGGGTANVARFRQINLDNPYKHHGALEFPSGQVVLLTRLCAGQHATVFQLPAGGRPSEIDAMGRHVAIAV